MNLMMKSFVLALAAGLAAGPVTAADNMGGASSSGASSTGASPAQAGSTPGAATSASATTQEPGGAMDVLTMLHHVNQMEVQAGQLAQKNAQSPAVQQLGKDLERDHKAAQDKVEQVAEKQGIDLQTPVATGPADQQKVEKMQMSMQNLETLKGAEFDRAFLKSMADGHKETIKSLTDAQAKATPEVKTLISQLLPTLQKHQKTASTLMKKQG